MHDINRAGGHPLHRAVVGGSPAVVTLLLDRSANIHAIHGVGSFEGYAPQDKQPIDLAIWGGPRQVPLSRWRCYANALMWLRWRRCCWKHHADSNRFVNASGNAVDAAKTLVMRLPTSRVS